MEWACVVLVLIGLVVVVTWPTTKGKRGNHRDNL